jgi:hypothetical protein
MSTQLDKYFGNFYFMISAIKYLSTGTSLLESVLNSEDGILSEHTFDEASIKIQNERAINYINEQLLLTPFENKHLYINDIALKLKDIELRFFANWDEKDNYIYNSDTIKQNFDLFLKCNTDSPNGKYIKSCFGLFCGFFKEIENLCIKFKIDFFNITEELNFILITPEATAGKLLFKKPFDGLLVDLSEKQLKQLFDFLTTENKAFSKPTFIDIETTDRQSFDYIFCGNQKPTQFKPIEWQANNQWLREILAGLQIEKTYHKDSDTLQLSNEVERQAADYFTKKGKAINIKSTKQLKEKPEYKAITKFLATI